MSNEERVSWVSLIVNLVVGGLYFSRVLALPAEADLFGPRTAAFATGLITIAVLVAIASQVVLGYLQRRSGDGGDTSVRDERDVLIELKSSRNGFFVLGFAVITVLVQMALLEWSTRFGNRHEDPHTVLQLLGTGPLQTMHVAQLLLLALTLGAIAVNASRVCYYRRGG